VQTPSALREPWEKTLEATAGVILVIASAAVLWLFFPKRGQPHPWMRFRLMQSLVPLAIVSALALGATMAISGI
jgi:hypothetical protein